MKTGTPLCRHRTEGALSLFVCIAVAAAFGGKLIPRQPATNKAVLEDVRPTTQLARIERVSGTTSIDWSDGVDKRDDASVSRCATIRLQIDDSDAGIPPGAHVTVLNRCYSAIVVVTQPIEVRFCVDAVATFPSEATRNNSYALLYIWPAARTFNSLFRGVGSLRLRANPGGYVVEANAQRDLPILGELTCLKDAPASRYKALFVTRAVRAAGPDSMRAPLDLRLDVRTYNGLAPAARRRESPLGTRDLAVLPTEPVEFSIGAASRRHGCVDPG
jgi:hypothetical protein